VTHTLGYTVRLLILAWTLIPSGTYGQEQDGPLETAIKYFEANESSRCSEAFSLYTKGTQENIRAVLHRYDREREHDDLPLTRTAETWACAPFEKTKPGSVHLVSQDGDEAVVARKYFVGHWLNQYIKLGPYWEGSTELQLIREEGVWRVQLPHIRVGHELSPGEQLVEVGRVDVSTYPHNGLGQDVVDATMVSSVPRSEIESVLRNPASWGKLFPFIQTVDVLEAAGGKQQVRLLFAGWEQPITVTVRIPGEHIDRLRFDAGRNAPVMFWGWWDLSKHYAGTRVTFYLVINKRQWPEELAERFLAPERIAESVLGLEQAALQTGR